MVIEGEKAIADALGVHERTVRKWAAREEGPLPLHGSGRRWARVDELAAFAREHDLPVADELEGRQI